MAGTVQNHDVIVVGARVAGAATARLLAQRGHRVLMVDRATFPSDTISTHCIDPAGMVCLGRWGLVDKVFATNTPPITKFVLTSGGVEYPADAPMPIAAPRRTVLDALLVDEARAAGADVREGVTVKALLRAADGAITGIAGVDADGTSFEAAATLVIGADGNHSFVAREVGAEEYNVRPSQGTGYYAYYAGTGLDDVELAFAVHRFAGVFPTNDGEACVFAGRTLDEFGDMRSDPDAKVIETLRDVNPRIAEATASGTRTSRFFKYDAQPGRYLQCHGPGWALVGDAGFHIDPVTGRGIGNAFVSAELLARAAHAGLSGERPIDEALAEYQATRDEWTASLYDHTQTVAELQWDANELVGLILETLGDTAAICEKVAALDAPAPA